MTTDGDGQFSLGGLPSARLRFERADLEPREVDLNVNGYTDVAVQRIVRINAGETVTPVPLAPNDLTYTMDKGETCFPCRMIRVDVPAAGTLQLRLKWTSTSSTGSLGLWVDGVLYQPSTAPEVAVSVSVSAGQRVVFVEAFSQAHVSFTLETSFSQ